MRTQLKPFQSSPDIPGWNSKVTIEWLRRACPGCFELQPEAQQIQPFNNYLIEHLLCVRHFPDTGVAAVERPRDSLQFQILVGRGVSVIATWPRDGQSSEGSKAVFIHPEGKSSP